MFQDGKEVGRVPAIISGQVQKFTFREEEVVNTFDLNTLYADLKKDKRFAEAIEPKENAETKKEKWRGCPSFILNVVKNLHKKSIGKKNVHTFVLPNKNGANELLVIKLQHVKFLTARIYMEAAKTLRDGART